ncbi:MAG: hypothetical protein JWL88_421 [Parcubacteria group bacterium]|nr:hypothetical protein [Parcubacteria group bacterium]
MKLLIVTQAVDAQDPVLGFFHRWIEEFAAHVESIEVICLREGAHSLPRNVRVHSLGKEHGRRSPIAYAARFLSLAWKLRDEYDAVFVHMNAEYVVIAVILWRALGKRVALWYLHKSVTLRLRIAVAVANDVLTASADSMRIPTKKKRIIGHGIDIGTLLPVSAPAQNEPIELITIGRLSPIKGVDVLIAAVAILRDQGVPVRLTIVGGAAGREGEAYAQQLEMQAGEAGLHDAVTFSGPQPHESLRALLAKAHLFVHASDTGSLDKAALEPLSVGVPIITSDPYLAGLQVSAIHGTERTPHAFAAVLTEAIRGKLWNDQSVRDDARKFVEEQHSLSSLVQKIIAILERR